MMRCYYSSANIKSCRETSDSVCVEGILIGFWEGDGDAFTLPILILQKSLRKVIPRGSWRLIIANGKAYEAI